MAHHLTLVMLPACLPVSVLTMQLSVIKKHYTMRDTIIKPYRAQAGLGIIPHIQISGWNHTFLIYYTAQVYAPIAIGAYKPIVYKPLVTYYANDRALDAS